MRLVSIDCPRLPGIDAPFSVEALRPGLNLVVGPNGIGKSSLRRAIAATLWPEGADEAVEAAAVWEVGGRRLRVLCRDRRATWEGRPPTLPPSHLARGYTLGVRDLLDPTATGDRAIGEAIRVEMAGGYDLAAVRRDAALGPRHGLRERRDLQAAEAARVKVAARQRDLAAAAADLPELRAARAEALAAQQQLDPLTAARDLAAARIAHGAAAARLAAFPAPLAHLSGDERDRLARLAAEAGKAREELVAVETDLARARQTATATELAGGEVDEVAAEGAVASARAVVELEREAREAEQARVAAATELAAIGGDGELAAEEVAQIEELVGRLHGHRQRTQEVATRLSLLPRVEGGEEPARLLQGESALRRWLVVSEGPPPPPRWVVALAVVAVVAGVALVAHPYAALPLGAGGGALVYATWTQFMGRRNRQARDVAQGRYAESRLAPPALWERQAVEARLADLRADLARADQARVAAEERRRLQGEASALAAEAAELEEEVGRWRARLGLAEGGSLHLLDLGHRLDARRRAAVDLAGADARLERARALVAEQRAAVEGFLAPLCLAPDPALGVAGPALVAATEGVVARLRDYRQAVREIAELKQRRARTVERLGSAEEEARGLLDRAGVADEAALAALLDRLGEYRKVEAEVARLGGRIAELEARLADLPDLAALSEEEAAARLDAARAAAGRLADLAAQVGTLEERIRQAEGGDALESSRAAEAAARDALRARREEAFEAAAAALLLDLVEAEHQEVARPPVLQRASGWFATFTHHRYTVRVADTGELVAEESDTGAVRGLAELSDGTRAQLLLAGRIAFATHHEAGERVPLMLDEALSLADPDRFDAVAEALLALAAEGRQILYFTANPHDCARWARLCAARGESPPPTIDLAAVRTGAQALDVSALTVDSSPLPPSPDGLTAEEYGAALGVAPPDPDHPAALHLFYLLRDDLGLLHRLLAVARVATVGQWRTLSRGGGGAAVVGDHEVAHLDALADLAVALFAAWRVGRGRPVDRAALAASGAVSDRYLDPLTEVAAEVGGDGSALLVRLKGPGKDARTHGFRANKREALAAYLREQGYLDPRPPLDDDALRARLLADLAPAIAASAVGAEEVSRVAVELTALLEREDQP